MKYRELNFLNDELTGEPERISLNNLNESLSTLLSSSALVAHGFNASVYLGMFHKDYVYFSSVTRVGLLNYIEYLNSPEFQESSHLDYLNNQLSLNQYLAAQKRGRL